MRKTAAGMILLACALLLAAATAHAVDTPAGPIFNNMDAQSKCPDVCQRNGYSRWTGQWRTLPGTATSVCDCEGGGTSRGQPAGQWKEAGPLFNQPDAERKCPDVCARSGGKWDGNWKTTQPGRMSVCSCSGDGGRLSPAPVSGSSCSARSRGACGGCSIQCAPGQQASCREGATWNDKVGNGDPGCVNPSECRCN